MIEVEVRNFQSIEKVNLKVEGFTALVGRSNIGKSALVRAVKAALTGAPVSSFVRHGPTCLRKTKKAKTCKCFSSVHLKSEGFDLLWEKGDAINRYTFNGVVHDKAEKGTPEFLSPAFLPVKIGDRQELLQVADQFSSIFLLDQTGGVVADVLSDVAQLDRINVAMRMAERDRKEAASTRKVREKDIGDLNGQLAGFDGLNEAVRLTEDVQTTLEVIEKATITVEKLDGFMASGAALGQRIKALEEGALIEVPDPQLFVEPLTQLGQLGQWLSHLVSAVASVQLLTPIENVLVPVKGDLSALVGSWGQIAVWYAQLVALRDLFNTMKPVEVLPILEPETVKDGSIEFFRLQGWVARLEALETVVEGLELDYAKVLEEEKEVHDEVEALGVCPTCVRPLGAI